MIKTTPSLRPAFAPCMLAAACCAAVAINAGAARANQDFAQTSPGSTLSLIEARAYMLSLINKDRASQGLPPVRLDPIASNAGQAHAEEMVSNRYMSHWDMAGKKPDQRYTEASGTGAVKENVFSLNFSAGGGGGGHGRRKRGRDRDGDGDNAGQTDGGYKLYDQQAFRKEELENCESRLFHETPPNDGHRKNILSREHNAVGIGIAIAGDGANYMVAGAQEFTENLGEFAKVPALLNRDESFTVAGRLNPGLTIHEINFRYEPAPKPMSADELKNGLHRYSRPEETQVVYWPPPYNSPAPVIITETPEGDGFTLKVEPGQSWKSGLYYLEIWAKPKQGGEPFVVSCRTMPMN